MFSTQRVRTWMSLPRWQNSLLRRNQNILMRDSTHGWFKIALKCRLANFISCDGVFEGLLELARAQDIHSINVACAVLFYSFLYPRFTNLQRRPISEMWLRVDQRCLAQFRLTSLQTIRDLCQAKAKNPKVRHVCAKDDACLGQQLTLHDWDVDLQLSISADFCIIEASKELGKNDPV